MGVSAVSRRSIGPRERLLAAGPSVLDDVEVLGAVLDGGRAGAGGRVLAERLLAGAGGVAGLEASARDARAAGLDLAPSVRALLLAAFELARRANGVPLAVGQPVRDGAHVWAHFRGRLPQLEREVFWVLLLDGRNRVRGEVLVSEGSLTATLVHPREVFAPALRTGAAALVLVHNHPSGDPTPSAEDVVLTERLRQVGELVGIRVLDHVVLGREGWVSMAARGGW